MKKIMLSLIAVLSIFTVAPSFADDDSTVFELRIYTSPAGKLPELIARFENHTTKIFERHGMINVGYWVPVEEKDSNKIYYILKHKSRKAAKISWEAFGADPEWKKVHAESIVDGQIVEKVESIFMNSTEFSAIK